MGIGPGQDASRRADKIRLPGKGRRGKPQPMPKWRNGRRRGFKIPRREACRFESGLGYHQAVLSDWSV